jgi:hypothetical protein
MQSVSANSNSQRDTNGNSKEGSGESRAKEASGVYSTSKTKSVVNYKGKNGNNSTQPQCTQLG